MPQLMLKPSETAYPDFFGGQMRSHESRSAKIRQREHLCFYLQNDSSFFNRFSIFMFHFCCWVKLVP